MLQQSLARMMAAEDVRGAMGWSDEDQAAQAPRQRRQQQQEAVEEPEEYPEEAPAPAEHAQPPSATAEAAATQAADENEIELAEDEEEEGPTGAPGEVQQPELDPELEALARAPGPSAAAAAAPEEPARDRQQEAARGEPRSWDDLSDGEQEGEVLGRGGSGAGNVRVRVPLAPRCSLRCCLRIRWTEWLPGFGAPLRHPRNPAALPRQASALRPPSHPLPAKQTTASARRGCTRPRRCCPPPTPARTSSRRTKIDACWNSCGRRWAALRPLASCRHACSHIACAVGAPSVLQRLVCSSSSF